MDTQSGAHLYFYCSSCYFMLSMSRGLLPLFNSGTIMFKLWNVSRPTHKFQDLILPLAWNSCTVKPTDVVSGLIAWRRLLGVYSCWNQRHSKVPLGLLSSQDPDNSGYHHSFTCCTLPFLFWKMYLMHPYQSLKLTEAFFHKSSQRLRFVKATMHEAV